MAEGFRIRRRFSFLCYYVSQVTKRRLPDVNVELPPRSNISWLNHKVVSSGPHNDTTFVPPKSEHIPSDMLVPLGLGSQQLPRVTVTSVRYNASFLPSTTSSTVFIFPSKPFFQASDMGETRLESVSE
ncbi:Hypothetical predicted protein [Olea europaea subsp. europaea]|uniref:Uncharacterized protein n=1 Tax=Olea europaea subsp. europaea TaxID=158383 RepID=A0A8S0QNI8_OLEEU|nr:Hypothetical predicted protein [Olea europaea subsp. europaea]